MSTLLRLYTESDPTFALEATQAIEEVGIAIRPVPPMRGVSPMLDVIVELGSAGVFTALYQVLASLLTKNKDREVTIEGQGGKKVTVKGHSLPQELRLLEQIAPELIE